MLTAQKCLYYVLDEEGKPVPEPDIVKWGHFFETARRVLRQDRLPNGATVTTAFLGVDTSWSAEGSPVLWGTMISGGSHNWYEERYASREDALTGHLEALALASETSEEE